MGRLSPCPTPLTPTARTSPASSAEPSATSATAATIRARLAAISPAQLPGFDAELAAAGDGAIAFLGRWALRLHPLSKEEQAQLQRFRRTDDCTGFWSLDGDGR